MKLHCSLYVLKIVCMALCVCYVYVLICICILYNVYIVYMYICIYVDVDICFIVGADLKWPDLEWVKCVPP